MVVKNNRMKTTREYQDKKQSKRAQISDRIITCVSVYQRGPVNASNVTKSNEGETS